MTGFAPIAFGGLMLLRPAWLAGLLLLPLLAWWLWRREHDRNPWRGVVDPHLLPHLLAPAAGRPARLRVPAIVVACALALLALAGPSWRSVPQVLAQGHAPLVVALDLSSATAAPDLAPTRLLQARAKIGALLAARSDGEVALVAFADDAFTVAPLTPDAANVALFLDALSPDVMPVDGSRADRAIDWSVRLLKRAGHARGDILLLGDHAAPVATTAAARAAAEGFRVSVLGLGTTAGAAYRRDDGGIATARLQPAGLQAVATAGGGRYVAATVDRRDVDTLLPALRGDEGAGRTGTLRTREDGGYWLLLPLLLLVALGFRRNAAVLVLAVVFASPLVSPPARAQVASRPQPDAQPVATPTGSAWQRADQQAHARMQAGIEAYRAGDFDRALRAWQGLPSADAAYNRGNALAKAGRFEDAIAAYDDALHRAPGMADAVRNRAAVEAAMARKPPSQGPRQDRKGASTSPQAGGEGRDARAADSARAGGQAGERAQPPPSTPSRQPPADAPPSQPAREAPPQPDGDGVRAQREADAAQRERMREALARGEAGAPGGDDGETDGAHAGESRADGERRASDEAWLRRVPDDPGGLLRIRFRLEHERRQQRGGMP